MNKTRFNLEAYKNLGTSIFGSFSMLVVLAFCAVMLLFTGGFSLYGFNIILIQQPKNYPEYGVFVGMSIMAFILFLIGLGITIYTVRKLPKQYQTLKKSTQHLRTINDEHPQTGAMSLSMDSSQGGLSQHESVEEGSLSQIVETNEDDAPVTFDFEEEDASNQIAESVVSKT